MQITERIKKLKITDNHLFNTVVKPIFFKLTDSVERQKLEQLVDSQSQICILDEIESQLQELIKLRYPKIKFTSDELKNKISEYLNNQPIEEYGVWVYYPWKNTLVHLLDEAEFVEVRTN